IALTTADSGGAVSSDGGATVTARGLCWNTSGNPTTADTTLSIGSGTGTFSGTLTPLTQSTTYYVRAYAVNSVGTAYGNQVSFTTTTPGTVTIPTVTTDAAYNITTGSADSGGNVTSDGGATVTSRGLCWSTSAYPTTSDGTQSSGSGSGTFSANLTGLASGTLYYARAYAVNSAGTAYGNQISFTTASGSGNLPTVTTDAVTNITETSADCGYNVSSDGGFALIMSGLCWSKSSNPTVTDDVMIISMGTDTGAFSASLSGLDKNTTYYVRAFALNSQGTAYGNEQSFTTGQESTPQLTVDRNNLYFGASSASAKSKSTSRGVFTSSQTIYINTTGSGTLNWSAAVANSSGWLSCSPASGTGVGIVTVSVDASGLSKSSYVDAITIKSGDQTLSIPVSLTVYDNTEKPFGAFETPINGSTVSSSVPVTGWALDDVDVQSVKIYRSPVTGECGT
ncbi:MAG: BACON domain-containing protein, partial [bacterium]|nr:BACON domain-containing protein [bacterium]